MMSTTRNVRTCSHMHSYFDRVDYDMCDHCFFVYDLSRYNNRTHYYYGETRDIAATELRLAHTVPTYKLVFNMPVDEYIANCGKFEDFVRPLRSTLPVLNSSNVFALDDASQLEDVIRVLRGLFPVHISLE